MLQQGVAIAFEDAIVLSELLAHFPVREALEHYQAERFRRVNWIVKTSDDAIKASIDNRSAWSVMARNLMIRYKGPLNVAGWKKLFTTCPLDSVSALIESGQTL